MPIPHFYLTPKQDDYNQIPELQVCLAEALYDIESILADPSVYSEEELCSDPNWVGPTQRTEFIQVHIKGTKSDTFLGLKKPAQPTLAVYGELEQKVFHVALVSNVPDIIRH